MVLPSLTVWLSLLSVAILGNRETPTLVRPPSNHFPSQKTACHPSKQHVEFLKTETSSKQQYVHTPSYGLVHNFSVQPAGSYRPLELATKQGEHPPRTAVGETVSRSESQVLDNVLSQLDSR
ncbi:unnamed protein product, partial [Ectocarpus sp. 12 AP-2014]